MDGFLENLLLSILRGVTISPNSLKISTLEGSTLNTVVKGMFDAVLMIGMGLSIAYFLLEINRKMMFERDDFTLKSITAPLIKLVLAFFVLRNGWDIVKMLIDAHNGIIEASTKWGLEGVKEGAEAGKTTFYGITSLPSDAHPFKDLSLITKCLACLPMLIAWLVSCVCTFVYWYKSIGYKIEFLYRVGLTPVAFADVYSGNNSNMYRWFKGFFAFALYGAAFIVIPRITQGLIMDTMSIFWEDAGEKALENSDNWKNALSAFGEIVKMGLWSIVKFIFLMLLAPIAAIGTISSVRQLTKEAFG